MRVMIGVTPDTHDGRKLKTRSPEEKIVYLWDRYLQALLDHGAAAVVLPVTNDLKIIRSMVQRLDGFLLAGGNFDVPSGYYGKKPKPYMGKVKPERSFFERALLLEAAKKDKPVLGICGGLQIINVAFGGTLYQDILEERPSSRDHQQKIKKTSTSHQVTVKSGTQMLRIMTGGKQKSDLKLRVNSTHHQAINALGKDLTATAHAPDGLIEAIERPGNPFALGIQFHPELLAPHNPTFHRIFEVFVECSLRRRAGLA